MSKKDKNDKASADDIIVVKKKKSLFTANKKSTELSLSSDNEKWKILIVDDEEDVHTITRVALKKFAFQNRELEFIDTYSAEETKRVLKRHPDTAVVLLDVVMETTDAGLELVKYIRETLKNKHIRIILRTGQPGEAPEKKVVEQYQIDDYKTKTELTTTKLYTVILTALRSYRYIKALENEISNRTQIEEALKESEEKYRALFNQANDAIFLETADQQIVEVNQRACEMFGYSREQLLSMKTTDFQPEKIKKPAPIYSNPNEYKKGIHIESKAIRKNGDELFVDISIAPLTTNKQNLFISIVRDITNRKKSEKELKRSYEKLQKTLDGIILAIVNLVEIKDPYTSGHQRRVAKLSVAIAKKLGMDMEQVKAIETASKLHDIGKIEIPPEILSRPGKLSQNQFNIIKEHPMIGYNILKSIEFPWRIAEIVLQHHERMDGSGYPNGLCADKLLPEAKIIGVADVVEAMASHRPYRPALGVEAALQEIQKFKGKIYPADIVNACIQVFEDGFEF